MYIASLASLEVNTYVWYVASVCILAVACGDESSFVLSIVLQCDIAQAAQIYIGHRILRAMTCTCSTTIILEKHTYYQ